MYYNKSERRVVGAGLTEIFKDDYHPTPFEGLTIWIFPEPSATYNFDIKYHGESQRSGGGTAVEIYEDSKRLFPPNQLASNRAMQEAGGVLYQYDITVEISNTGIAPAFFVVNFVSAYRPYSI